MTKRNTEGYADPTAYEALSRIERDEGFMPVVYICSPYAGDIEKNKKNARRYCRLAVDKHCIPVAPHLLLPQFMDEKKERQKAMRMCLVMLSKSREIWVCGEDITTGMAQEIAYAEKRGIKRFDISL